MDKHKVQYRAQTGPDKSGAERYMKLRMRRALAQPNPNAQVDPLHNTTRRRTPGVEINCKMTTFEKKKLRVPSLGFQVLLAFYSYASGPEPQKASLLGYLSSSKGPFGAGRGKKDLGRAERGLSCKEVLGCRQQGGFK